MTAVMVSNPLVVCHVEAIPGEDCLVWVRTPGDELLEGVMVSSIFFEEVVAVLGDNHRETHLVSKVHQGVAGSIIVPVPVRIVFVFDVVVLDLHVDGVRKPGGKRSEVLLRGTLALADESLAQYPK